ncbi:MAG: tetratricopeptide repeat protein, partial [Spirochaetota bacterium]
PDGSAAMRSPLALALLAEADSEASRYLVVDAYNRQDWYAAATLLDSQERETMDKAMVATILRKSGRIGEALSYSSDWFSQNPESEAAAEAYLRTLAVASSGTAVASLGSGGISDIGGGLGILSLLTAGSSASGSSSQSNLLGLVLKIISGGDMASYSSSLRSYILYLNGTIQKDRAAAIENYHKALFEEADNIEAILGLAVLYKESGDVSKAQFYLRQARMIGTNDKDLLKTMEELEKALASG